jgi:hypothetical protein
MMWRSQFRIDALTTAKYELHDPYKVHQFITLVVDGTCDSKVSSRSFAFHVRPREMGETEIRLQSWRRLKVKYPDRIVHFSDVQIFPEEGPLPDSGVYSFFVEFNSCYKDIQTGKRLARSSDESIRWLRETMSNHGAEIREPLETGSSAVSCRKQGREWKVNAFRAIGNLKVNDFKAFLPAMVCRSRPFARRRAVSRTKGESS